MKKQKITEEKIKEILLMTIGMVWILSIAVMIITGLIDWLNPSKFMNDIMFISMLISSAIGFPIAIVSLVIQCINEDRE